MAKQPELSWEIGIPLLNNPTVMRSIVWVCVLASLVPGLLLGLLIGAEEGWEAGLSVLGIFALVGVGLLVTFLLVIVVIFGNRFNTRFSVSAQGILQETIDRRAKVANTLGAVAGAVSAKPGVTGAHLLARSQEAVMLRWQGAFRTVADPHRHSITLRNRWRPLMVVQCRADNYAEVLAYIDNAMAQHGSAQRLNSPSPLPAMLLQSALVVLASVPLFALQEIITLDVFVLILIVTFALATVWLVPLLGWVVLAANAYLLLTIVVALFTRKNSVLFPGRSYLSYEVLDEGEWVLLALALLGMAYLSWLALRAIGGRFVPLLVRDMQDMG